MANDAKPLTDEEIERDRSCEARTCAHNVSHPIPSRARYLATIDRLKAENEELRNRVEIVVAQSGDLLSSVKKLQSDLAVANGRLSKLVHDLQAICSEHANCDDSCAIVMELKDRLAQLEAPRSGATEEEQ